MALIPTKEFGKMHFPNDQTTVIEPLFETVLPYQADCRRCLDTGIWLTPRNQVETCPKVQLREAHKIPNPSAEIVKRSALRLKSLEQFIVPYEFELARILTHFSTENPCPRIKLDEFFFLDTNMSAKDMERKTKKFIENLLTIWLLPVGSRRSKPSGYWIITELEDYKAWVEDAKSPAITRLSTIYKNAKHNFPHFAEQMELEFWKDMEPES